MNKYKVLFFDWDGTAVISRTAPVDEVLPLMVRLLEQDTSLVIISGTTYENIAGGRIHELIPKRLLKNLYLGLGRGAYNYGFDEEGLPQLLSCRIPDMKVKRRIHEVCFYIHMYLLEEYNYETDIVFSRPNYCKVDLLVDLDRKGKLFLQPGEIDMVSQKLKGQGYDSGIMGLIKLAEDMGKIYGSGIKATTDAKYLEVGITTKSDNVDFLFERLVETKGISIEECCFWGDEFTYLGEGILGSDAYMITQKTENAEFFDVSESPLKLPSKVKHVGGGHKSFLRFLKEQDCC